MKIIGLNSGEFNSSAFNSKIDVLIIGDFKILK